MYMSKAFFSAVFVSCLLAPFAHAQTSEQGGPVKQAVPGVIRDREEIEKWANACLLKPSSCDRHTYEVQGFGEQYELFVSDPKSYANLKAESPFREKIVFVRMY